ncbi:hypothetical protein SADUNF_Sadunf10G0129300 [Salix dunnii]|uniref:Metallo-beta-lactamase domain-containing protein n=1 Tax=Salix dunnii TaxID=1413687 RepID=A0A835JQ97_9ROSI|nr:hypothetical protein SADUNF_Sadunf10G0129300 [Salix dunnii]
MALKITLRYPEVGLPSSLFSGQRRLNANSKGGKVSVIRAIQSQEEAAAAAPTSIQYQARRMRRPQNIEGEFFVDHTCIDCDTCRWMAPQVFTRVGEMSAVFKQPTSGEERLKALQESYEKLVDVYGLAASFGCPLWTGWGTLFVKKGEIQKLTKKDSSCRRVWKGGLYDFQSENGFIAINDLELDAFEDGFYLFSGFLALLSCPTSSIHTEKPASDILQAQKTFPTPIDQQRIPGVYHCGYHSEKSYGAASFLIVHPEGNIIIDSPRYTERLARNIEMLGGARYMFLTHEDDVADHRKWSERLSCDRVDNSTADVETKLQGTGPWNLGKDVQLIHTPGHTEGSVCLFYKPLKILFTGDHLLMTETGLSICERYNRCSVQMQIHSVLKLLEIDFNWIIPVSECFNDSSLVVYVVASIPDKNAKNMQPNLMNGHGRRVEFKDREEKDSILKTFVEEKYCQYM